MARTGQVSAVITEDSDLLVYQCPRVLYKMDRYGEGAQIMYKNIRQVRKPMDLSQLSPTAFRYMCILSGCDYAASIYSMGLKRAYKYVLAHETPESIVRAAGRDGMVIPPGYLQIFHLANHTFLYQRVWDPREKQLTSVESPIPSSVSTQPYIGALLDAEQAKGVVEGRVNPMTLEPFSMTLTPSSGPKVGLSVIAVGKENRGPGATAKLGTGEDEEKEAKKKETGSEARICQPMPSQVPPKQSLLKPGSFTPSIPRPASDPPTRLIQDLGNTLVRPGSGGKKRPAPVSSGPELNPALKNPFQVRRSSSTTATPTIKMNRSMHRHPSYRGGRSTVSTGALSKYFTSSPSPSPSPCVPPSSLEKVTGSTPSPNPSSPSLDQAAASPSGRGSTISREDPFQSDQ